MTAASVIQNVNSAKVGTRGFPSLRQHATGVYFWREKGKNRYVGSDLLVAQRAWIECLGSRLNAASSPPVAAPVSPTPLAPRLTASGRTVSQLAERLWYVIDSQCTPERARVYRFELAHFLAKYGSRSLTDLSPDDLLTYRAVVVKMYKPWTANGRLSVVRRLLTLADTLQWIDRPFRTKLLGGVAVGETKPKAWTPGQVTALLAKVAETDLNLARMMRLQFLGCLRPFSVPELVHGRGEWEGTGVFALSRSKTEKRTGERQRLCLSDAALKELGRIKKACDGGALYRQQIIRAGGKAPHPLRHSACTALANAGVPDEIIECAMGHSLGRVKSVYRPQKFQETRKALAVLAELVPEIQVKRKSRKIEAAKKQKAA